jgi:hypothetical protein
VAVWETGYTNARALTRGFLELYLGLPNYVNNWRRMDFEEADFQNGGSDRLIDDIIVWGDEAKIRARIQAHWDAGADHVCVQALGEMQNGASRPDEKLLASLAGFGQ